MIKNESLFSWLSFVLIFTCSLATAFLVPVIPSGAYLMAGMLLHSVYFQKHKISSKIPRLLLNSSIIFLGFGLSFQKTIELGMYSFAVTFISILCTIALGFFLMKLLKVDQTLGCLLTVGTAICGGSAIAAVSGAIGADDNEVSESTLNVFFLNGIALFVFPIIGRFLLMNQSQFATWAALAIHDTSSVVGAANEFGPHALELATTIKLTRSLWIMPVALTLSVFFKTTNHPKKFPLFIIGFILAAFLAQLFPRLTPVWSGFNYFGKNLIKVSILFVGSQCSILRIFKSNIRPLLMSTLLWISVSVSTAIIILNT